MEHHLIFLFFFISICNVVDGLPVTSRRDDEIKVLVSIKSSLIDPLDQLRDWTDTNNGSVSHCNWTGIGCNSIGAVERLDLSNMNLSGRLSEDIQWLKRLSFFNVCCNSLSSSLPRSLSNLTFLQNLDVSQNFFVGSFPRGLYRAGGLISINGSGNNFSGSLPEDLGNVTSLEYLDFRGSFFEGTIPKVYKNLQRLKFLGLSGNNLSGQIPGELGQLSSLEKIIIGYNGFVGSIPPEFGNLMNLRYLDMAVGNLVGEIPGELGRLELLTTVFLYKNRLQGKIPWEIGNMTSLVLLDLSDNQLSGAIPVELGRLMNLQLLSLMCNRLEGPIPAALGELTGLEVLELWNNSFSGSLPESLGKNSQLQWLDVSSNSFSGEIPTGLCNGGNLTKLILFNNLFIGTIPAGLSMCSSLVRVRIQNNYISGTIPTGLGKLLKLQRLELANNSLAGKIPIDIALSTALAFIDLSTNRLESSLPSNILSIPTLQSFIVSNNNLSGEIPDQFQDCPSLSVLDLSNNQLSGSIPASIASCEKLVNLNLHNNRLTGEIPKSIAMMPTLAILDLSNNNLMGSIPENFGGSPALETLNVSYNMLQGTIPTNGVLRTINPNDLAGNPGLCGGVLPPCSMNSAVASTRHRSVRIKHIVIGWVIGISVVLLSVTGIFGARWLYNRWYLAGGCCEDRFGEESGEWPWRLTAFQRLNFTSGEILRCIKESNVIGMGATGIVYKAETQRPRNAVAVKKLWTTDAQGSPNEGCDFVGEVNLLAKLRHKNIVRLLGFLQNCSDTMLIYEYVLNGSLGEALHGDQGGKLLVDWVSRYNVAVGVAQGLAYLHHDCHPPVIHRDIKSNNILLDGNLEVKIADFGLARLMMRKTETVSMVAGSYGYIAPEYGYTLKVDQKIDIYSYGVVLMELLTGKKPLAAEFGEGIDIVEWVRGKIRSNKGIEEALDPSLGGQCNHVREEMLLVLRIALLCTAKFPKDRPSMRDVIMMLGEAKPRRKSSSTNVDPSKEKPIFSTSPVSGLV